MHDVLCVHASSLSTAPIDVVAIEPIMHIMSDSELLAPFRADGGGEDHTVPMPALVCSIGQLLARRACVRAFIRLPQTAMEHHLAVPGRL